MADFKISLFESRVGHLSIAAGRNPLGKVSAGDCHHNMKRILHALSFHYLLEAAISYNEWQRPEKLFLGGLRIQTKNLC